MKNYNIIVNLISAPAKALIHLGKSLWFFVFQGKGKGERTSVLREGKEAFLYGLLHSHRGEGKREGGKGHVDHHIKGSKEEEEGRAGRKGRGRKGRRAEGKELLFYLNDL